MAAGHSYQSAGVILGRSYHSIRSKCKGLLIESQAENTGRSPDAIQAPPLVPTYDKYLRLTGDWLIVADVHSPCTDWLMATRAVLVAKKYLDNPRLIVAGDLMNFDVFSRYAKRVPLPTLRHEIDGARYALGLWSQTI